ncbi:hypothetical protein [Mucilaginibacter segetis]|uniref:Collagen triple helix repeat protein n=1 Tax=Mucilaginibacter segetis TaxID=2793071 RepID=A0A934PT97_9SPHI|nr:hypothetical protein [Mucilaginibacter segetis]MBK0378583.1 hypothetical protein [Mucilaginibacter segetis]
MATDKKINELPVLSGISANDISVLVNNGVDYQFTISLLLQYLSTNLSSGASIAFGSVLPQNNTGKNGDVFLKTSTGQFAQKIAGEWAVVYTLPEANAADGALLFGAGLPGSQTGKNSDSYVDTLTGIFYLKGNGTWAQVFSMQTGPQGAKGDKGDTGAAGQDGKSILSGTSNPSNQSTGNDGDFYINVNTFSLFGPKTSGAWGAGIPLINYTQTSVINFEAGGNNPITIENWQDDFFTDYGNGEFLVQLTDEDGNLQDRPDIGIKRIINRSGDLPMQTGISLDLPEYPSGRIIVKYSNLTLL